MFKYLGIDIHANSKSPHALLHRRLHLAKVAFLKIRNNAQLLGLSNCRVRLQLITSLVVSVLLFGAPLYACISDESMVLRATAQAFREAEDFAR